MPAGAYSTAYQKKEDLRPSFFTHTTNHLLNGVYFATTVAEEEEQAIGQDKKQSDNNGVEILVGNKNVADVDDKLRGSITCRNIEVRHLQVVDHGLVCMLTVSGKDITTCKETLGNGEETVCQEDYNKTDATDILARAREGVYVTHKQKEDNETHTDAANIARETTCFGAEVEETENKDGDHDGGDELNVYEPVLKEVKIAESADHYKRIGGKHAIYAIHEVVNVEDTRKEYDEQNKLPWGYGGDVCPKG